MLEELVKRFDLVAASGLVWMLALVLGYVAIDRLSMTVEAKAVVTAARALQPQPVQLSREPVSASEYNRIAEAVRPYVAGGLKIEPSPSLLSMVAERVDLQPAMTAALNEIIAAAPDYQWAVEAICIGPECKPAITVKVKAYQVRKRGS
jgi:hypothetical protein